MFLGCPINVLSAITFAGRSTPFRIKCPNSVLCGQRDCVVRHDAIGPGVPIRVVGGTFTLLWFIFRYCWVLWPHQRHHKIFENFLGITKPRASPPVVHRPTHSSWPRWVSGCANELVSPFLFFLGFRTPHIGNCWDGYLPAVPLAGKWKSPPPPGKTLCW